MTARTITIYDPDGNEYVMEWYDRFDQDEAWCQFCDKHITSGWAKGIEANLWFILCDDCAQANATTEGR